MTGAAGWRGCMIDCIICRRLGDPLVAYAIGRFAGVTDAAGTAARAVFAATAVYVTCEGNAWKRGHVRRIVNG